MYMHKQLAQAAMWKWCEWQVAQSEKTDEKPFCGIRVSAIHSKHALNECTSTSPSYAPDSYLAAIPSTITLSSVQKSD